jgi:hypothetical protein
MVHLELEWLFYALKVGEQPILRSKSGETGGGVDGIVVSNTVYVLVADSYCKLL